MRRTAGVVVVGAGISGLVAADRIRAAGRSVLVLEARPDRVGGRLESADHEGLAVDLGGACIGASHDRATALMQELGIRTWQAHCRGERVAATGSNGATASKAGLRRRLSRLDMRMAERRLAKLTATVSLDSPEAGAHADRLDARSLGSWIDSTTHSRRSRASLRDILTNVLCDEPDVTSLLHGLFYLRAGGGLAPLIRKLGGAQQDLVAGGTHSIAAALADRLGDAVVLGAPVRRIAQQGDGVVIESDALTVEGESAIVAVPPPLAARISYSPPLPPERERLMRALRPGDAVKAVALYDEAFWRGEGLNGEAWGPEAPFSFTHDVSSSDGSPGVMSVFFVGRRAAAFRALEPGDRRSLVVDSLVGFFGPRAARPNAYLERDWNAEEWSQGGYGSVMPPGAWTSSGAALRGPAGRVHWAGTETATEHHGYIEGAVRAGERAAAEVLETEALKSRDVSPI